MMIVMGKMKIDTSMMAIKVLTLMMMMLRVMVLIASKLIFTQHQHEKSEVLFFTPVSFVDNVKVIFISLLKKSESHFHLTFIS